MKTTMFKNSIANLICLFVMTSPLVAGYSQICPGNQISISVENMRNPSSKTIEFDVYITNTGSTSLSLASVQGAVIYDEQMIPKGANVAFSTIKEPATNFAELNSVTTLHSEATNQLRWIQNPVSLSSGKTADLPINKKLKFASFRVSSSEPMNGSLLSKIKPHLNVKFGYTTLLAVVYCDTNTNSIALKPTGSRSLTNENSDNFTIVAYPNPYTEGFHLDVTDNLGSEIQIKVYDMLGKLIENKTVVVSELENLTIGSNYPSGIYNLNVSQGSSTQSLRIIRR